MLEFEFTGELFRWQANAAWHFIALPVEMSRDIDAFCRGMKGGFGSLPVQVTIGGSTWSTSIFPDKGRDTYVLPIKAQVRRAEGVAEGDAVDVALSI